MDRTKYFTCSAKKSVEFMEWERLRPELGKDDENQ